MPKNRTYNWPKILADFEQSDLSQVEFCQQHDINPKYFNTKLSKKRASSRSFDNAFTQIATADATYPSGLMLEVGQCKIHCPDNFPIASFAALVKTLA